MKNREKFAEQIVDIALEQHRLAVDLKKREPCDCMETKCSECLFSESNRGCDVLLKEWAEKECEEPPIDWSKVPVDTPILVRDYESMEWTKRYFAKYENGKIYAWGDGATSWSHNDKATCDWKFAKLAEGTEYD